MKKLILVSGPQDTGKTTAIKGAFDDLEEHARNNYPNDFIVTVLRQSRSEKGDVIKILVIKCIIIIFVSGGDPGDKLEIEKLKRLFEPLSKITILVCACRERKDPQKNKVLQAINAIAKEIGINNAGIIKIETEKVAKAGEEAKKEFYIKKIRSEIEKILPAPEQIKS